MRAITITVGALLMLLGACSGTTTTASALAIVQAEATTVDTAVDALAPALIAAEPAAKQAALQAAVTALDASTKILETANLDQTTAAGYVKTFLTAAEEAVVLLPIPTVTADAIDTGLALGQAFLAGLPVTVAPATAAVAASPNVVPGPVPVPLS